MCRACEAPRSCNASEVTRLRLLRDRRRYASAAMLAQPTVRAVQLRARRGSKKSMTVYRQVEEARLNLLANDVAIMRVRVVTPVYVYDAFDRVVRRIVNQNVRYVDDGARLVVSHNTLGRMPSKNCLHRRSGSRNCLILIGKLGSVSQTSCKAYDGP
jgi:hypothetical protein